MTNLARIWVARLALASGGMAIAGEAARALPAFSADVALRAEGETMQKWRLASSGERIRVSPVGGAELQESIADIAARRIWSFTAGGKDCTVASSEDPVAEMLSLPAPGAKEEALGEETVAGFKTRKLRVTIPGHDPMIVWRAPDLGDLPVRTLRPTEKVELSYSRIERGPPKAELFQVPAACPP